eukprot:4693369-Pleurochrysis_carterae.AAC.1
MRMVLMFSCFILFILVPYPSRLEQTRDCGAGARAATEVARPIGDRAARSLARVAKAVCSSV